MNLGKTRKAYKFSAEKKVKRIKTRDSDFAWISDCNLQPATRLVCDIGSDRHTNRTDEINAPVVTP